MLALLACVGIGYLSGSLPFGLWIGRWFGGLDVRTVGSGNLGATNVFRVLGPRLGIVTLLFDVLKGAVPVWLVARLSLADQAPGGVEMGSILAGASAVAGHVWTFLAGFRGGKGVATTVGVLLALAPPAFGAFVLVFGLTVAITRFVSLGSVLGAIAFAITLGFVSPSGVRSPTFVFGVLVAALVVLRHHENLRRLVRGEERRFSIGGRTR